ncbi:MAG: DUF418 domain-containing protein [Asticcacaulis sp.]
MTTGQASTGRIRFLDHLRGLSLLAILLVNAIAFAQPFDVYVMPTLSPLPMQADDRLVWWIIETFFKEKFITGFTLLFGISLFLVGRDADKSVPVTQTPLFRRLSWLVVFGLIHGALIWHGDILLSYAVTGFIFWRWKDMPSRVLLSWGSLLFLGGSALLLGPQIFNVPPDALLATSDIASTIQAMRGDFAASLMQNMTVWAQGVLPETLGYLPSTLGLMMLGLGLFKAGILNGEASNRACFAMIAAAVLSLIVIGFQANLTYTQGFPYPQTFGLYAIANSLLCLPVALGYAAALILIGRVRTIAPLLYPLACVGRMAFSNYLMQSLIMTGLFYGGRGPDWFGTMNHAALLPIVISIWIGQILFSVLWLQFFRYGPFEWVWRCLTYNRRIRIFK